MCLPTHKQQQPDSQPVLNYDEKVKTLKTTESDLNLSRELENQADARCKVCKRMETLGGDVDYVKFSTASNAVLERQRRYRAMIGRTLLD